MTNRDLIKAQQFAKSILLEVLTNDTLKNIDNFGDLHDHCDANCLGGACEPGHWLHDDPMEHAIIDEAQSIVSSVLGVINAHHPDDEE